MKKNISKWLIFPVLASLSLKADFEDLINISPVIPLAPSPTKTPTPISTPTPNAIPEIPPSTTQPPSQQSENEDTGASGGLFSADVTKHNTSLPLGMSSKEASGNRIKGIVTLVGDVVLTQADSIFNADFVELYTVPGTTEPFKALGKGNIKIEKKPTNKSLPLKAVADEFEYQIKERKAVLTGKPKIWRGKELIEGQIIEVDLDTGEVNVREARSLINPKAASPKQPNNNSNPKK